MTTNCKKRPEQGNFSRLAIFLGIILLLPFAAMAQNNTPDKPFTPRHSIYYPTTDVYHIKGDFQVIANANMYQTGGTYGDNHTGQLHYNDVDDDPRTVNSTSAELQFSDELGADPTCSKVLFAGLYWCGKADMENDQHPKEHYGAQRSSTLSNGNIVGNYTLTIEKTMDAGSNDYYTCTYTFTPNVAGAQTVVYNYIYTRSNRNEYSYYSYGRRYYYHHILTRQIGTGDEETVANSTAGEQNYIEANNQTLPLNPEISLNRFYRSYNTPNSRYITSTSFVELFKNQVMFKHENGTYQTITAHPNDIFFQMGTDFDNIFVGYAEVTDIVRQYGEGNYFCANICCPETNDPGANGERIGYCGAWCMVVVYENSNMKWRDITVFDGDIFVESEHGNNIKTIDITGIKAVQVGHVDMKMAIMAAEGDRSMNGDYMEVQKRDNTYVRLQHSGNQTDNFFNSSIVTGGNARNPNNEYNVGVDCAYIPLENNNNEIIDNNQTSVRFRCGSNRDVYSPFFFAFSCDAYIPEAEGLSAVMDLSEDAYDNELDAYVINPGDTVVFHVDVKNLGTEDIVNAKLELPLPITITHYATSVNYSDPSITVSDYFDAARGINGTAGWDLSELPAGDVDKVWATLELKCIVTEDCYVLAATDEDCLLELRVNGTLEGYSYVNNVYFKKPAFIRGYVQDGQCRGAANRDDIRVIVDKSGYLEEGNCTGDYDVRDLSFCDAAYPNGIIPFNEIYVYYPIGTRFFNYDDQTVEYTLSTGFPTPT